MRLYLVKLALGLALAGYSVPALSQTYPNRPIRVIAASSVGGISDVFIRFVGETLRKNWDQPLIIENRPGGNFNIAAKACVGAAPDGYTICILPGETVTYNKYLLQDLGFDPETQLTPITNLFFITQTLVANHNLGIKDLDDLARYSRQHPGTLSYAAPGLAQALFIENFKATTGADLVRVPFKGGGEAVASLLSGTTPVAFLGLGNVLSQIRAGSVSPLAVDSMQRSSLLAATPTLAELNYRGDVTRSYFGLFAPANTPSAIIAKISTDIKAIFDDPATRNQVLIDRGLEPAFDGPDAFAAYIKQDSEAAARVVKATGVEAQ